MKTIAAQQPILPRSCAVADEKGLALHRRSTNDSAASPWADFGDDLVCIFTETCDE